MNKKILIFFIVGMTCIFMTSCGTNKEVKAQAEKIITAVEANDMNTLENIIMGTEDIAVDDELKDFFTMSEEENNGLIAKIIEKDSIKIKKIKKDTIQYEITAPQLENIFQEILEQENIYIKDFENYIYSYIESAPKQKIEVNVSYTYEDSTFTANYKTEEFMNGITGNMISSYQKLIQEVISEKEESAE